MEVKIKRLDEKAIIPFYGTEGAAGMDIVPISMEYKEDIDCYVYHTGLAFEIPKGYAMFIFPRSSNRKTNAYLPNSVGILDSDYRGELQICFKNRDNNYMNRAPYEINGKAIAQIVIMPYPKIEFKEVEELSETERGECGFGSTNEVFNIGDEVVEIDTNRRFKIIDLTQYIIILKGINNKAQIVSLNINKFIVSFKKVKNNIISINNEDYEVKSITSNICSITPLKSK